MGFIPIQSGSALRLQTNLPDGLTTKFPVAHVYTSAGTEVVGSPFTLTHLALGLYRNLTFSPSDGAYTALYIVYNEVGHTTESNKHGRSSVEFEVSPHIATIVGLNNLSTVDVQSAMTSQGYTVARSALLDLLDAAISTRSTQASMDIVKGVVDAILVDTGTSLPALIAAVETKTQADIRQVALVAEHDATQSILSTVGSIVTDILVDTGTSIPGLITALNDLSAAQAANAVWDELIASHANAGSTGEALSNAGSGVSTPSQIADAVWDELTAAHISAGSFGLIIDVIEQFVRGSNNEIVSGVTGLAAIKQEVIDQHAATVLQINANETKIDDIRTHQDTVASTVNANIDSNEIKINAIIPQIVSTEANLKSEIDINEVKIDAVDAKVGAIQNNTTVRFIVPEVLYKPVSGDPTKTYQFHFRLFDTDGNAEAPDSTPTIRVRSLTSGLDIIVSAPMTQDGVKVGAYYYNFPVSSGNTLEHLLVEATVVEAGATRFIPATTEVVEFQTELDAIQAQLTSVETKVDSNKTNIESPSFGLSAIRTKQDDIVAEVNVNEAKLDLIKPKTDLIPADPATETTLSAVSAAIAAVPDTTDIQVITDLQTASIKGASARNITEVYNKIDYSALAKTADPRFAFLNAAISSRSSHTANSVWSVATRELTAINLSSADLDKVWDTLLTAITTPGSVGELVKANLDDKVSGAATVGEMSTLLAGVAQESTLSNFESLTGINFAQVDGDNAGIKLDTSAIKPKTDLIPASPANEATLVSGIAVIRSDISNTELTNQSIKLKTDNIPSNPSKEGSVLAIPTNTVSSTDPRLDRLDADISSRSTLDNADLALLAKKVDLDSTETNIIAKVNVVEVKVDQLDLEVGAVKVKTDNLPIDPASNTQVINSEIAVRNDIGALPPPGGGATASEIWGFSSREVTNDPNLFKADVSGLATSNDIVPTYENRMSTAFNDAVGTQEVLVWAQKDGQTVIGSGAKVTVRDANGTLKWTNTLATPNSEGVFKFVNAITIAADANFYIDIEITVDSGVRKTLQPFFTTG